MKYLPRQILVAVLSVSLIVNPALANQRAIPELMSQQEKIARVQQQGVVLDQNTQAALKKASNGTTVVDIAAPSERGVSHNKYQSFNVDQQGVILNNSAAPVLTQLGGWTDGNRHLAGGEARIILNEVTGASRSELLGHVEIAGKSAEFILANANGITCDGCGFINTPRVSLITGKPNFGADGKLSFDISGGDFLLQGKGLNAVPNDRFDIISRAVRLNAEIYANELNILTGFNNFNYETGEFSALDALNNNSSIEVSLDTSALGGMYANTIRLIGTEKGVGVNTQGLIQSVTDLELSADGQLTVKQVQANKRITLESHSDSVTVDGLVYGDQVNIAAEKTITNQGLIAAASLIELQATDFEQSGDLYAGLTPDNHLVDTGGLKTHFSNRIKNTGSFYVGGNWDVSVPLFDNTGEVYLSTENNLSTINQITNASVIQFGSAGDLQLTLESLDNSSGLMAALNADSFSIAASGFVDNQEGNLFSRNNLSLVAQSLINTQGQIGGNELVIAADSLINQQGDIRAEKVKLTLDSLDNHSGKLVSLGDDENGFTLNVVNDIDNTEGVIYSSAKTGNVSAASIDNQSGFMVFNNESLVTLKTTGDIANNSGVIQGGELTLDASAFDNTQGEFFANNAVINAAQVTNNQGVIQGNKLLLDVENYLGESGVLLAQGANGGLVLNVQQDLVNTSGGVIKSLSGDSSVTADNINNTTGVISLSGNSNHIAASSMNNTEGLLFSANTLNLDTDVLTNNQGLVKGSALTLAASTLDNSAGVIQADAGNSVISSQELNNLDGIISVAGDLQLEANTVENTQGVVDVSGRFTLDAATITNDHGVVRAQISRVTTADISNRAGQLVADNLQLSSGSLDNTQGFLVMLDQLSQDNQISILDLLNNTQGQIYARGENLTLGAGVLINNAGEINHLGEGDFSLVAESINNQQGAIHSGKNLIVSAGELDNRDGKITASNNINAAISASVLNESGLITAANTQSITANTIENRDGLISADTLALTAETINNDIDGRIESRSMHLDASELINAGSILALGEASTDTSFSINKLVNKGVLEIYSADFWLDGMDFINDKGTIIHHGQGVLKLNSGEHFDNSNSIIATSGSIALDASSLNNHYGQLIAGRELHLGVEELNNHYGVISTGGSLSLNLGNLNNQDGQILIGGDEDDARLAITGLLDNRQGKILYDGQGALFISAASIDNSDQGLIGAQGNIDSTVVGSFNNNDGYFIGNRGALLSADSVTNDGGVFEADMLQLNAATIQNAGVIRGWSAADTALIINTSDLNNQSGLIESYGNNFSLLNVGLNNNNGIVSHQGNSQLYIEDADLNNDTGGLYSKGTISLALASLQNTGGAEIYAGKDIFIQAAQILNDNSLIQADAGIQLTASLFDNANNAQLLGLGNEASRLDVNALNNSALIAANGNLEIGADTVVNAGITRTNSNLQLDANSFINSGVVNAEEWLFAISNIENLLPGRMIVGSVHGTGDSLQNAGLVQMANASGQSLLELNTLVNSGNIESSNAHVVIKTEDIDNSDGTMVFDDADTSNTHLSIESKSLSNTKGRISAAHLILDGDTLDNSEGTLLATDLQVTAGVINNTQGVIQSDLLAQILASQSIDNTAGRIVSLQDRLDIDSQDIINQSGFLLADAVNIQADGINNQSGTISGDSVEVNADSINNLNGKILTTSNGSGTSLSLNVASLLDNTSGTIQGGGEGALISAAQIHNDGGSLAHFGSGVFDIQANELVNTNTATIYAQNQLKVAASQNIRNEQSDIESGNELVLTSLALANNNGRILADQKISLSVAELENTGIDLNSPSFIKADQVTLNISQSLNNNQFGRIEAENLQVNAVTAALNNEGVILSSSGSIPFLLQASLLNNSGIIQSSANSMTLAATGINNSGFINHLGTDLFSLSSNNFNNTDGRVESAGTISMLLDAHLDNTRGLLLAQQGDMHIQAASLSNANGELVAASQSVNVAGEIDNNAGLITADTLEITAGSLVNTQHQALIDADLLSIHVGTLTNENEAIINANHLSGSVTTLNNHSGIQAGQLTLTGSYLDNTQGKLIALMEGDDVLNLLFTNGIKNHDGNIESKGNNLNLEGAIDNRNGRIALAGDGLLTINEINNADGILVSNGGLHINSGGKDLDNKNGIVHASSDLRINANNIWNTDGDLIAGNGLYIESLLLDNQNGLVLSESTADNSFVLSGSINNYKGTLQTAALNATFTDVSLNNNEEGVINHLGSGLLQINGQSEFNNQGGKLVSQGNIDVQLEGAAGVFNNQNGLVSANHLVLSADALIDNSQSGEMAAKSITLTSTHINNSHGHLFAVDPDNGSITLNSQNTINNANGELVSSAFNWLLNMDLFDNSNGRIIHTGQGELTLNSQGVLDNKGIISSKADVLLTVAGLDNQGSLIADKNLSLNSSGSINNDQNGLIKAGAGLTINADGQTLVNQGEIYGIGALNIALAQGELNNSGNIFTDAANASLILGELENAGTIAHNGTGILTLVADDLNNQGMLKSASGRIDLSTQQLANAGTLSARSLDITDVLVGDNQGRIEAETLAMTASQFNNAGDLVATGSDNSLALVIDTLTNTGSIASNSTNFAFYGDVKNTGNIVHAGTGIFSLGESGAVDITGGTIKTAGYANLTGNITGAGDLFAQQGVTIATNNTFDNSGATLYTAGNILIQSGLNNTAYGEIVADGTLTVSTTAAVNNDTGLLQGNGLTIAADTLSNQAGTITALGNENSLVQAKSINNQGGTIQSADHQLSVIATDGSINNQQGWITNEGAGVTLNATQSFDNTQGNLLSSGNLAIDLNNNLVNARGNINGNSLIARASVINNNQGYLISSGNLDSGISANSLDNRNGFIISASNNIDLTLSGTLDNRTGQFYHEGTGTASINLGGLQTDANSLMLSEGNLDLVLNAQLNNAGQISAKLNTGIQANNINNTGVIISETGVVTLDLEGFNLTNAASGYIAYGNQLDVKANKISNQGSLESLNQLNLELDGFTQVGTIKSNNLLTINLQETLTLGVGDSISAPGSLNITTAGGFDNRGLISSANDMNLTGNFLNNWQTGEIKAGMGAGSTFAIVGNINNHGLISSASDLAINSSNFFNFDTGRLISSQNITMDLSDGSLVNRNVIYAANNLNVGNANIINNLAGGVIFAGGDIMLDAVHSIHNSGSRIESLGDMTLKAGTLIANRALVTIEKDGMTASRDVDVVSESHQSGDPQSGSWVSWVELEGTQIDTTEWSIVVDKESIIRAGGDLHLDGGSSALIRNQYGSVTAGGNMRLDAADLELASFRGRVITTTRDFVQAIVTGCMAPGSACSGSLGPKPRNYGPAVTEDIFTTPLYGNFYAAGNLTGSVANKITAQQGAGSTSNNSHSADIVAGTDAANPDAAQGESASKAVINIVINAQTSTGPGAAGRENAGTANGSNAGASDGDDSTDPTDGVNWQWTDSGKLDPQAIGPYQATNNPLESLQQLLQGIEGLDTDALHQAQQSLALEKLLVQIQHSTSTVDGANSEIDFTDSFLDVLEAINAGTNPFGDDASLQDFIAALDASLALDGSDLSAADELLSEKAREIQTLLAAIAPRQQVDMAFGPINFNVLPLNFDINNLSGLYVLAKSPGSRYLIETRPEFTDYQIFLGSDYLLEALGYDPDDTMQRLGDAFFENALIRDALMAQAGTRYLGHNTSDYEQMMYLMNNAVVANQQLQLTLGVELTPEQCAALTQDIMWLVKKRVNGHTVLVPHLYLVSVSDAKLAASESAIAAGKNIDLRAGGDINIQTGVSAANSLLLSTQGNLEQSGKLVTRGDVRLIAGQQLNNTGTIDSRMVGLQSQGTLTNIGSINAAERLVLSSTQDAVVNTATGRLVSAGDLSVIAEKNIHNQQGYMEGADVNLVSKTGDIINRTEITTTTSRDGRITRTEIGEASTIVSHNNLLMDAGNNLDLQGSQLKASNDIQLKAGNDIQLDALKIVERTDSSTRKRTRVESETSHQVVSIEAGHKLTLEAGGDINAQGTEFTAGGDLGLIAGRDLNLTAVANTTHSEDLAKRKKRIDTETIHTLVDIESGGNVTLKAGQDANLTGTQINAAGDVSLAAERDTNLTAVVDSDYHYDYTKKKKSFGRSKTTENETLDETVVGGVINAGGNILVNAHANSEGKLVTDASGNVNLVGTTLNAGNHVVISADEDVNITGKTYQELDYHRTKKSSVGGLSKKDKGTVEADTKLQNAQINAGGSAHLIAGDDLTLAATDVMVDGNINMEAVDHLLITAGEVINNSERWSKKSGIGSGGNLYGSKEHKSGEGVTSTQASTLVAGGTITGHAGSGEIVGSDIVGAQGVQITSDMGDIDVKAGRTSVQSYSYDKEMSVGLGDMVEGLSRPDQLIKTEDGRATVKLADAKYDEVDTKTNYTEMRSSRVESDGDVTLVATAGSVNIVGSDITADADQDGSGTLGLAGATGVNITEATETYETSTKEVHGEAELSFVVQHQAAEVVKAVIALDEAKDKLEQAKKDYNNYERNVNQLEEQLSQLEADYANKVPGVNYDDLLELRELVSDVKGDKEWYQTGIALAAVNLTSATTALIQQTAAAAQSASTWGFNAGLQLDIDASKTDSQLKTTTAVASNLSGNKIVIQTGTVNENGQLDTKGTNTTISGSHLNAKEQISIQTGDLNLLASKNTSESSTETEHGHVTAQMTVYGASGGASVSGSYDRNKNSDRSTTYNNSTLTADNIDLQVSGDANIRGANVHANNHLQADIDGNLNLESVQNRSNSRNTGMGVSGGVSFGGNGDVSGVNGGINNSNGMSVTRETVLTSLTSGGTADVNVQGHTQITGALLATVDEEGKDLNQLTFNTGSLSTTDLRNIKQTTQTSAGISTNLGVGEAKDTNSREGQPTAEGANGKTLYANTSNVTYANTNENSASKTLATLGHGNITVGGVQLEKNGELTEAGKANGSPLIAINRDTQNTEKELWNSEQGQTVDATLDHRLLTSDGRQQIKNDAVDTKEFGQDIGRAVGTVRSEAALGVTDFWQVLDNNTKATQLKNELTRNPEYAGLLEGLKSQDGDTFAESFAALGQVAQAKFGISPDEFGEIFLYDGDQTTSTSLGSTLFVDTKGGTVLDKNNAEYGNIFVNADGSAKTDLLNTLGHETLELNTLLGNGKNDATQEAHANAFGAQFSDRINQAAGSSLDATGGSSFNASLQNSFAITQGTIKANAVGSAEVDNRRLRYSEAQTLDRTRTTIQQSARLNSEEKAVAQVQLNALACAAVKCASGVPEDDPLYYQLTSLQGVGEQLNAQGVTLDTLLGEEAAGEFEHGLKNWFDDQLTSQDEGLSRVGGAGQAVAGALGMVGGATLTTASAVGCGPSAGLTCLGVPAGVGITVLSEQQGEEGLNKLLSPYEHKEGQGVVNSFSPDTHQGDNNPTADLAMNVGITGIELITAKVGGKYLDEALDGKVIKSEVNDVSSVDKGVDSTPNYAGMADAEAGGVSQYDIYKKNPGANNDSEWDWPDQKGFNGVPTNDVLPIGTRIDRYGNTKGSFLSPEGTPFSERALAPGTRAEDYNVYEVIKPLPVLKGEVAPAFGEVGGGIQILPNLPTRANIQWLISNGYLKKVN